MRFRPKNIGNTVNTLRGKGKIITNPPLPKTSTSKNF